MLTTFLAEPQGHGLISTTPDSSQTIAAVAALPYNQIAIRADRRGMEVTVRGKHVDVPDRVVEHARRKLGRLDHYLPLLKDGAVEVDIARERTKEPDGRYLIHVTVHGNGVHLRAEERAAQPEAAIDLAARVLTEQARRHKQRLYGRSRSTAPKELAGGDAELASSTEPEDDEDPILEKIGKVKRFPVKPMTVEEAVEQMELLQHDFFLFMDADLRQFGLIYRRHAGDYGLIIPEHP